MIYRLALALVALGLGTAGCNQPAASVGTSTPPTNGQPATNVATPTAHRTTTYLDHAQPKLTTLKLWVGSEVLETELALRPVEIQTGMMYRTEMGENEGMLFVFAQPYPVSFYMRNTRVPLSAAYIDPEGRIAEIHDLEPFNETPVPADSDRIQYVLEVKQGWFKRHNVPVGALIRSELGALAETFHPEPPPR